jgi:hypothetical protein
MTALARTTRDQNIEEISIDLLDQIYYSGYVAEMLQLDPAKIEFELAQMESQFTKKN